jgi:hypothetical protein
MTNRFAGPAAVAILAPLLICQFSITENVHAKPLLKEKTVKRTALQAHAQATQDSMDVTGKHGDHDVVVREWDGELDVEASLIYWEGDERTVSLVLAIEYPTNQDQAPLARPKPPQQLFAPSTILVLLPNGHSYRPFNQVDVLQAAYAAEKGNLANTYSGYNPPPVTTYNTDCSLNGDTASCRTTADQSAQAGYAVGFALGAAIKNAFARHKAEKYIKQVKESYLVSTQIPLGAKVMGYVDLYVEDVHSGPFTVRIPVGDSTHDFIFGPEVITSEIPKEK